MRLGSAADPPSIAEEGGFTTGLKPSFTELKSSALSTEPTAAVLILILIVTRKLIDGD